MANPGEGEAEGQHEPEAEVVATSQPASDAEPDILRLTYELSHPVEIYSFTSSLEGMADLHKLHSARLAENPKDVRLYIREIRRGSVEVDLVEMIRVAGGALAPIVAETHTVIETFKRAKAIIDWLRGDIGKPEDASTKEVEAVSRVLSPAADNHGSSLNIAVNGSPGAQIYIGSIEANAIQNQATRALELMREPSKQTLSEIPFTWHQTDRQGATTGRTGMKAIVEEISSTPLPVYFAESERVALKKSMVEEVDFPFQKTFIVDIETIVVSGKIKGIKVLHLHDVLD